MSAHIQVNETSPQGDFEDLCLHYIEIPKMDFESSDFAFGEMGLLYKEADYGGSDG